VKKALGGFSAAWLALVPMLAFGWTTDGTPTDPILSLQYPKNQTAFSKIPKSILKACTDPTYGSGWIFAKTTRPEGDYLLLYGPVWVTPDVAGAPRPILEYGTNGAIARIGRDGKCQQLWDADNAFGLYFPGNPDNEPTPAQASLIQALAADLMRRSELALGGPRQFLRAFDASGQADREQDKVMIPLLHRLREAAATTP